MKRTVIEKLPRVEGTLRIVQETTSRERLIHLESGKSSHLENRLMGKYPLEAVQLTQSLSESSSVSHAVASVMALEDYLGLEPTGVAVRIRQILSQLSAIQSHIYHFYWRALPDYLNEDHFTGEGERMFRYHIHLSQRSKNEGDLPRKAGIEILKSMPLAASTIGVIQRLIATMAGKYPIIMNQIPGGVTNFRFLRATGIEIIRRLEETKRFIEVQWHRDIKRLIFNLPDSVTVLEKNSNLISFGSLTLENLKERNSYYSDGVLLDGKLEPVNEIKISESLKNTFYMPFDHNSRNREQFYNDNKPGARTWIKGARYDGETMLTGALSRMLVTHFGGGNLEVSDSVGQIIDDLELSEDSLNCVASRLLAEVFEGRFYLKSTLQNLLDLVELGDQRSVNRRTSFDFSDEGTGTGRVESPAGALMHQVFVEDDRIVQYRIVSAANWILSTTDEFGRTGMVEKELNRFSESNETTPIQLSRILHSHNVNVLDGVQ